MAESDDDSFHKALSQVVNTQTSRLDLKKMLFARRHSDMRSGMHEHSLMQSASSPSLGTASSGNGDSLSRPSSRAASADPHSSQAQFQAPQQEQSRQRQRPEAEASVAEATEERDGSHLRKSSRVAIPLPTQSPTSHAPGVTKAARARGRSSFSLSGNATTKCIPPLPLPLSVELVGRRLGGRGGCW